MEKMKVCLIITNARKFCPYIANYIDVLSSENIDFDIVEWDRRLTENKCDGNIITFGCKTSRNKVKKVLDYLNWKRYIQNALKKGQYDKIIVFTSIAGVLIHKFLIKKYKNKYIFDILDYSYEQIGLYRRIVDKVIDNSYITCISSKGFLRFISPSEKIMIKHNMPLWFAKFHKESINLNFKRPYRIGYLGMISYLEQNKKICEQIKNNVDFIVAYYGTMGKQNIYDYCMKNNIKNVNYYGPYNDTDKFEIYKDIDFINAIYGNDKMVVTTALPNKLYDCLVCKKPIIVSDGTYLSKIVQKYNLGITLANDANIEDEINKYIDTFDVDTFNQGCNKLFSIVTEENKKTLDAIRQFLTE